MSGTASGGAVKRKRRQPEEEEDVPASKQVTAHAEPLTLLAVFKLFYGMHVWLQLCSPQGVALFSFVRLPPRVPRPFAGAPVYEISLTRAERLRAVGCGFKGRLVRMLSLGVGRHLEPQRNWGTCHKMMQSTVRWVASQLLAAALAAVRDEAANEAEELCVSGQCAAAVVPLQRAIDLGHLPSRALMAWLLSDGREGVAKDEQTAFELAEEGARLGCHHCKGVMACCYFFGCGCVDDYARSLELARESAGRGSRYGQFTLGQLCKLGRGLGLGVEFDDAQALAFFRLAAAQGLDAAQFQLGFMLQYGYCVVRDCTEGLRLLHLAAAQGCPEALYEVAACYEHGYGVAADVAEAIRWYRRAQAAGDPDAAGKLQELGA
jgi:TPR repeat protein